MTIQHAALLTLTGLQLRAYMQGIHSGFRLELCNVKVSGWLNLVKLESQSKTKIDEIEGTAPWQTRLHIYLHQTSSSVYNDAWCKNYAIKTMQMHSYTAATLGGVKDQRWSWQNDPMQSFCCNSALTKRDCQCSNTQPSCCVPTPERKQKEFFCPATTMQNRHFWALQINAPQ